jgi:hypothetical protein
MFLCHFWSNFQELSNSVGPMSKFQNWFLTFHGNPAQIPNLIWPINPKRLICDPTFFGIFYLFWPIEYVVEIFSHNFRTPCILSALRWKSIRLELQVGKFCNRGVKSSPSRLGLVFSIKTSIHTMKGWKVLQLWCEKCTVYCSALKQAYINLNINLIAPYINVQH